MGYGGCLVWCRYLSCSSGTHHGDQEPSPAPPHRRGRPNNQFKPGAAQLPEPAARKGCAVAAQPSGKAATTYPSYLHTAEVADILHVSPKTVSRWAKEGRLPCMRTLGGHRRYPELEIRELAEELREEVMT